MTAIHRAHLPFLVFLCIASALGWLLWGFDAIVISGTINPVKEQFSLSPALGGFFVSSGLLGAVIGSALAGWLSDRFARWIGGLGVGISAMVCPLYISEISPTHLRGRLVTVFQFAITVAIMVALSNKDYLS